MPNNDAFPITPGTGRNVLVDHDLTAPDGTANTDSQGVKILAGKSQTVTGFVGGRYVDGGSTSADAVALSVDPRFNSTRVKVNSSGLTTATTSYSADDTLGAQLTFAGMARASGGTGMIVGATLLDLSKVVGAVDCYLFAASSTPASDNAASTWSAGDMDNLLAILNFAAPTQASASATNQLAVLSSISVPYYCSGGTSLYAVLVTRQAHTFFTAATDLHLALYAQLD